MHGRPAPRANSAAPWCPTGCRAGRAGEDGTGRGLLDVASDRRAGRGHQAARPRQPSRRSARRRLSDKHPKFFAELGYRVAAALTGAIGILDPEMVVLGGAVGRAGGGAGGQRRAHPRDPTHRHPTDCPDRREQQCRAGGSRRDSRSSMLGNVCSREAALHAASREEIGPLDETPIPRRRLCIPTQCLRSPQPGLIGRLRTSLAPSALGALASVSAFAVTAPALAEVAAGPVGPHRCRGRQQLYADLQPVLADRPLGQHAYHVRTADDPELRDRQARSVAGHRPTNGPPTR